jgi:hypothetical protein
MGANKTFQSSDRPRMLGDSPEFRRLRRAVGKAGGDRDLAIRNVCRLYGVKAPDALPAAIRAAALALLDATLVESRSSQAAVPGVPKQKP